MKTLKNESPVFTAIDKALRDLILASIDGTSYVAAVNTSSLKREPLTVRNAQHTMTAPSTSREKGNQTMSTLTANRILQKGDQYKNGDGWKDVPEDQLGLQIMFSKLKKFELRRPSEGAISPNATVQSPKAEKGKTPAPSPSGAGEPPKPISAVPVLAEPRVDIRAVSGNRAQDGEARESTPMSREVTETDSRGGGKPLIKHVKGRPYDTSDLPTVISPKAHKDKAEHYVADTTPRPLLPLGKPKVVTAKIIPATKPITKTPLIAADIKFTKGGSPPIWTGRNGTFNGYGVSVYRTPGDKIMLQPIGKRGAGNCIIEIPLADIPNFIRALDKIT